MSSAYESSGRVKQKSRTRQALVDAAKSLLAQGLTPTVEQAAAAARVSRPTAYRYFPNQQTLLAAAHPQLAMASLLPPDAPNDPVARLDLVSEAIFASIVEHEVALRAMLRIALERTAESPSIAPTTPPPALRTGRRVAWLDDALSPLRDRLGAERYRSLVLQIGATLGIESYVWLVDVANVRRSEAVELLRQNARQILRAAL
ncbi:MAG: TetR/AcrR family transcriptional regulator [bacterium]|nr:TetR/AcrR family transcriptional regulator [bacterium]